MFIVRFSLWSRCGLRLAAARGEYTSDSDRSIAMAHHQVQGKMRWGELEEEDGEDLDFLLPPKQVIGPDENGIKKVIEYKFDDDGNKVKITTTTRTRKLANARLSKRAVERRSWPKFGDAVHEDVGARLTMVSTEEILLERPKPLGIETPSLPLFSLIGISRVCSRIDFFKTLISGFFACLFLFHVSVKFQKLGLFY